MNSGVRVVGFGKCLLVNTAYKKDDLFSDHSCIIGLVWMDNIRKKQLKQICFVINKSLQIKEHAAVPYTALHKEFQHKQNFSCSTRSCSNHVVVPQQMLFPVVNMCLIGTFVCFLSHKGSPQQMDPHILFGNILRQLPFPQSPSWAFVPPPLRLQLFCILSKCNNNYIWDFHVRLAAKITDVWQ